METIKPQEITPAQVQRAYKGKIGCMCGCKGKYFEPGSAMATKVLRAIQANEELAEFDPKGDWIAARIGGKEHCIYLSA
jgi:hypothetical protein